MIEIVALQFAERRFENFHKEDFKRLKSFGFVFLFWYADTLFFNLFLVENLSCEET